jgi:Ca2+-binding RTX toxin-like protein
VDGSGLRKLSEDRWNDVDGWSPDGRVLLLEDRSSIWTMRADGSRKRRLVTGGGASFSPDGARIVFHRSNGSGATRRVDVLVMTSEGRDVRTVFRGGEGASWSPDGKLLALSAQGPCTGRGIHVLRSTGGGAHRLTNDCRIVGTPGRDVLAGTRERDVVRGLGGDDVVRANPTDRGPVYYGRNDDDFVDGGAGNDRIWGGRSTDLLLGGPGNDVLHGGRGADRVDGGPGNDVVDGGRYYDRLVGGSGNDLILARDGFPRDHISCGPGRDRVVADPGDVVAADCEAVVR